MINQSFDKPLKNGLIFFFFAYPELSSDIIKPGLILIEMSLTN